MVVIFLPLTDSVFAMQERVGNPSIKTVHAPHWPSPQPYFGPVISSSSRNTLNNGRCPSASRLRVVPFTSNDKTFGITKKTEVLPLWLVSLLCAKKPWWSTVLPNPSAARFRSPCTTYLADGQGH